ncbi:MAG: hypothetical protein R2831_02245 [Chitinophagaceae bacterium]
MRFTLTCLLFVFFATHTLVAQTNANSEIFYLKSFKTRSPNGYKRFIDQLFVGKKQTLSSQMNQLRVRQDKDLNTFTKFSKASFYPISVYDIPNDKKELATELFKAIYEDILAEANSKPIVHVEIIIVGYTDLSDDKKDLICYDWFCKNNNKTKLAPGEYELYMSAYRAKSLSQIIIEAFDLYKEQFSAFEQVQIDIIAEGRGTQLPDEKEYESIDDKRRKAVVYWKIIN